MSRVYDFGHYPMIDVPYDGIPATDLAEKLTTWLITVPEEHRHTARVRCNVSGCGHDYCEHEFDLEFVYSRPLTRLEAWRNQPEIRDAEHAAATAARDLRYPSERGDRYWPPIPDGWEPTP